MANKVRVNLTKNKKNIIVALILLLVLITLFVGYLILRGNQKKDTIFKESTPAKVLAVDFASCSLESKKEDCENTQLVDGREMKLEYVINYFEEKNEAFILLNDKIVLDAFHELNNKIYYIDDIIAISVKDQEQSNTIIYFLDLDGNEVKKIEKLDDKIYGMKPVDFLVDGRKIIIESTSLFDEFHYLAMGEELEEYLYVCNFKDNNFTGKEIVSAKYIIKYKGNNEFSPIMIDKNSKITLNDYIETINCEEEPNPVKLQE